MLMFKGLLNFQFWEEVCPQLLEDVRGHAAPFAPSLESLQDVLLCPREATTAFHSKQCAYSKCQACGWKVRLAEVEAADTVLLEGKGESNVFVRYQAYENVRQPGDDNEDEDEDETEAVPKVSSRPVLSKQELPPSVFLRIFEASQYAYQKHRFIAVHQTYMEQLLKTRM
jgi:hypothetical protein